MIKNYWLIWYQRNRNDRFEWYPFTTTHYFSNSRLTSYFDLVKVNDQYSALDDNQGQHLPRGHLDRESQAGV